MKVLVIHNEYGRVSGEEISLYGLVGLFRDHGHEVSTYLRSSAEIPSMRLGKPRAFFSGIYNPAACKAIARLLRDSPPDVVLVKNLFPLISPAILPIIRRARVPIVMSVPNYRLMCPNGLHVSHGQLCQRCLGGREYWCGLRNCESSLPKSIGYATRSLVARKLGWFKDNVSAYICASRFLCDRLIAAGFDRTRIHILPNLVADPLAGNADHDPSPGDFVGYAGRISLEKGAGTLLQAAALCPQIAFQLAGRVREGFSLPRPLPANVTLLGHLAGEALASFYRGARMIVTPSECFETFGMSTAEALLHRRPVIASRIGVLPEFVRDGVDGLLFEPGNAAELADRIRYLWDRPELCRPMGRAGRERALAEYSPQRVYPGLMAVFEQARAAPVGGR